MASSHTAREVPPEEAGRVEDLGGFTTVGRCFPGLGVFSPPASRTVSLYVIESDLSKARKS